MWVGLDRFTRVLAEGTLAATIFLSLVVVLMLLCRQPARRIVLAQSAALLAVLMLPLATLDVLPKLELVSRLGLPDPALHFPTRPQHGDAVRALDPAGNPSQLPLRSEKTNDPAPFQTGDTGGFRAVFNGASSDPGEVGSWWTSRWPWRVLSLFYLAGVTTGLAWLLLGFWGVGRIIRVAVEPAVSTSEFYQELLREFGTSSSLPRLRVSPRLTRPVLTGLIRPTIMIPAEFDRPEFDRELLKIILLHELAHADQGDSQFSAAASLAQCVWFFLPFPWWLRAQLRMDQEFVADQRTVLLAGSSAGYASRLVGLASRAQRSDAESSIGPPGAMLPQGWWHGGFKSPLLQRVVMLLHCPFPIETRAPRWWRLSAQLLILLLAILSASISQSLLRPVAAAASTPASTQEPARFEVSSFVASARVVSRSGRSLPYVLPLLLPSRFDLQVELRASQAALARVRLAGLPLGRIPTTNQDPPQDQAGASPATAWHHVHITREGDEPRVEVDGQEVPVNRTTDAVSEWLMIEPAHDETVVLRNLVVTW